MNRRIFGLLGALALVGHHAGHVALLEHPAQLGSRRALLGGRPGRLADRRGPGRQAVGLDHQRVRVQLEAVLEDLPPDAIKTGMLASPDIVAVVAGALRAGGHAAYVLDPVMVATSGDRLLTEDAEASLLTQLVPLSALVTPNLAEAEILTGHPVATVPQMADAARALSPAVLYPYHFGDTDTGKLIDLLEREGGIEVRVRKLQ